MRKLMTIEIEFEDHDDDDRIIDVLHLSLDSIKKRIGNRCLSGFFRYYDGDSFRFNVSEVVYRDLASETEETE